MHHETAPRDRVKLNSQTVHDAHPAGPSVFVHGRGVARVRRIAGPPCTWECRVNATGTTHRGRTLRDSIDLAIRSISAIGRAER